MATIGPWASEDKSFKMSTKDDGACTLKSTSGPFNSGKNGHILNVKWIIRKICQSKITYRYQSTSFCDVFIYKEKDFKVLQIGFQNPLLSYARTMTFNLSV